MDGRQPDADPEHSREQAQGDAFALDPVQGGEDGQQFPCRPDAGSRGVDNRRLKRAGFDYRFTSAGTVADFVEALRIRRTVGATDPEYQYERDVEQFFRHSPAVVRDDA